MPQIEYFKDLNLDQLNFNNNDAVNDQEIVTKVQKIITDIKKLGDKALFSYSKKFDDYDLGKNPIKFTKSEIKQAALDLNPKLYNALKKAQQRIATYHKKQLPKNIRFKDEDGLEVGWRWYPLESVGIYVPGGLAAYPSSVLMTATIAQIAGVKQVQIAMPCPGGKYSKAVLAAAELCGVTDIYKIGGAQAVAAFAHGTESVEPVVKIVGPGNAYVATAKKLLYGEVGIDSIAGPSEILVLADNSASVQHVAYDLLSQAEHDKAAKAFLITDSKALAEQVIAAVEMILPSLDRQDITATSWKNNARIFVVNDLAKQGVLLANKIAPEHLEIIAKDPESYVPHITTAGALFLGKYTTESVGDYLAGPSHVLPTSGTAKFSSGLSILDFLRRSSVIDCSKEAFVNIADTAEILALEEGLECHARAITIRES